jgi:hypothetical protein
MLNPRRTWVAAPGALLLALAVSGAVLGATVLTTGPTPEEVTDPLVVGTAATWEDVDGNGIDDDCQDGAATVDADAALAAFTAADTDGDGTISVDEAAHTAWVGGANCNHGGFVSFVAEAQDADEDETEAPDAEEAPVTEPCEATLVEAFDPTTMTFGEYVSSVAESDAVGGTNCNHGGAVSEAVHAAQELAKAERAAAKAERQAERAAAKAERQAERTAAKAERDAAKAAAKAERQAAKATHQTGKGKHGG